MVRFLIRTVIFLATAALALWLTSILIPDYFSITLDALVIASVIFAILQAILAPFVFNMARKFASFLLGGVGLVSTLIALLLTSLFVDGLVITGATGWIVGTLIVWLITAIGGWALGLIFLKERAANK